MSQIFKTKAQTLVSLTSVLKTASIAPIYIIIFEDWILKKDECVKNIIKFFGNKKLIVRSSSKAEDCLEKSNAGMYKTILNVEEKNIKKYINEVFDSYDQNSELDEVLIQPMLENVIRSGVAFSHDQNSNSPYRIINWTEGADTTKVTSGMGGNIWQQAASSPLEPDKKFKQIIDLIEELLFHFDDIPIDCEFAITKNNQNEKIWLLQVRPLIIDNTRKIEKESQQKIRLQNISERISLGLSPNPYLIGSKNVFGVMPDWNPAEIIGIRPKPLALSLYRDLVTDSIWAYQRNNYGYRNLRSFPLMINFYGLPYIEVRVSFNSFIPADLDDHLSGRLVDHYINCLLQKPTLHDKVEFEIVFSCYCFDLRQRLNNLPKQNFSSKDKQSIMDSLRKLTIKIIDPKKGLLLKDSIKIETLRKRRKLLFASNTPTLEKIYWLIEDAKRWGTLPFAGLARSGFIAIQLLKSLQNIDVITKNDYQNFIGSINTISGQLILDKSLMDKECFLKKYGHLRPGTYDILSPRYDEKPELYFDWIKRKENIKKSKPFHFSAEKEKAIGKLLKDHQLQIDTQSFLKFIKSGIELREYAKFYFTKNLSDVLFLMKDIGKMFCISEEDLAYCDINLIKNLAFNTTDMREALVRNIEEGKKNYDNCLKTALPPLITKPEDVWEFNWPESDPNYITHKTVTGPVIDYRSQTILKGGIVCIPNADPGFDWLFAQEIGGLITCWGGANSHMAIRAFELNLPAVIGVGEMLYKRYSNASKLFIDCSSHFVEILP